MKLIFKIVPQSWLDVVCAVPKPDFVNLWHADGREEWRRGRPGDKVIFVVGQGREIVGYGTLYSRSPELVSQVWLHYGRKNGVHSESQLRAQVSEIQRRPNSDSLIIGSLIVCEPVVFSRDSPFLMQSALTDYEMGSSEERTLEQDLLMRLGQHAARIAGLSEGQRPIVDKEGSNAPSSSTQLVTIVEAEVWKGYKYACGVTRWSTPCTLKIVHIRPLEDDGACDVGNMMLLCLTYAALYDADLICFNEDGSLVTSDLLSEYDKRTYGRLGNESLRSDIRPRFRPNLDNVRWRLNRFRDKRASRAQSGSPLNTSV